MLITNALNIQEAPVCALIYGAPGAGKTSLIRYLPGQTLVLDIDRTSGVLKGCANVDIAYIDPVNAWDSWSALLNDIVSYPDMLAPYDNVCVDNISELERSILAALGRAGKNHGIPAQADYQFMQFKLINSLRYMRALNKNLIWTAWEQTEQYIAVTGQTYSRVSPRLNGKIVDNVCGLCNIVGRMVTSTVPDSDDTIRWIDMTSSAGVYAKNQFDARPNCLQNELFDFAGSVHIAAPTTPAPVSPAPISAQAPVAPVVPQPVTTPPEAAPRNEQRRTLLNVVCQKRGVTPGIVREVITNLYNDHATSSTDIDTMPDADWDTVMASLAPHETA